jgi:hypothetical protein
MINIAVKGSILQSGKNIDAFDEIQGDEKNDL